MKSKTRVYLPFFDRSYVGNFCVADEVVNRWNINRDNIIQTLIGRV